MDYKATAAMCFAMGLLSWVREHIIIGMLLSITDIFEYNIRTAVAISSVTASIAGNASNIILMAMRKMSLSPIYQVVAVLGLVLLYIYMVFAFLFAACTTVVAAQALSAMWVSASTATPGSISLAVTFARGL